MDSHSSKIQAVSDQSHTKNVWGRFQFLNHNVPRSSGDFKKFEQT